MPQHSTVNITYEQFRDYVHMKSFDVIGDNNYRRYVVQSKENGEEWAQRMCSSVNQFNTCIKRTMSLVDGLQSDGKIKLYKVCQEVTSSLNHPLKERPGWNICFISGERTDSCVEVSRSGRSDTCTIVHSKYSTFISFLWYVVKFEQIIRMMTKQWIEAMTLGLGDPLYPDPSHQLAPVQNSDPKHKCPAKKAPKTTPSNAHQLCTKFADHEDVFHDMYLTFCTAYKYVHTSLEEYNSDSMYIFRVSTTP